MEMLCGKRGFEARRVCLADSWSSGSRRPRWRHAHELFGATAECRQTKGTMAPGSLGKPE